MITNTDTNTIIGWMVYHPDGEDVGSLPKRFKDEGEAIRMANVWNCEYPGHIVIPIVEDYYTPSA